jgi:hypothetical protein
MIKFRHYRSVKEVATKDGLQMQVDSHGGATLAFTTDDIKDTVHFVGSFAYCNPKDNYNKRYGRAKSVGFLNQNAKSNYGLTDYARHFLSDADTMREFLSEMDEFMLENGYSPY